MVWTPSLHVPYLVPARPFGRLADDPIQARRKDSVFRHGLRSSFPADENPRDADSASRELRHKRRRSRRPPAGSQWLPSGLLAGSAGVAGKLEDIRIAAGQLIGQRYVQAATAQSVR